MLPEVKFPEAAWTGLLARYRDLVGPCTEAPPEFHYASFIAAVGCLVGRKAWINNPHPIYPNFYSLLIGETAQARKTTAYQFALRLLDDGAGVLLRNVQKLHGLASVEGLATKMQAGDVLCVEDEFRSLVTKGGQKAVANIIPKVTELFNCPPFFEVNTKNNPIRVENPFLGILSASTPAWFEKSLSKSDVSGGFLNRWLLFHGQGGKLLAFPPALDERQWGELVVDICVAVDGATGLHTFSPPAKATYERFYTEIRTHAISEATTRMDLHAKKLALLYAILAGRREVSIEDVTQACAVAKYCAEVVEPLAERLEVTPQMKTEERFLDLVTPGPITAREAYRKLHVTAGELRRMAAPLVAVNQVTLDDGKYALAK
jgi:hypothetical protein